MNQYRSTVTIQVLTSSASNRRITKLPCRRAVNTFATRKATCLPGHTHKKTIL